MSDWRNQYESAAEQELAEFRQMTDDERLESIREGRTGEYYTIWQSIAARGISREVCWTLYDVLIGDHPYLDRYHCANALLKLLGCTLFEPVELSAAWPVVTQNLASLEELIGREVGAR